MWKTTETNTQCQLLQHLDFVCATSHTHTPLEPTHRVKDRLRQKEREIVEGEGEKQHALCDLVSLKLCFSGRIMHQYRPSCL